MDAGALGRGGSHGVTAGPPLGINRVSVPVFYLMSVGVATAQTVAHLYVVAENESRLPRGREPQKRLMVIADRNTFQSDMDVAVTRCVMFSQVKNVMLHEDHLAPLTGAFCEYDMLIQQSSTFDVVRTLSAIFKPHAVQVPTYAVEDGRMLTETVDCRLAPSAFQDVVGTAAQEASLRQLRSQKDREVVSLQEALQKQKDESLLEMVELHTQNETLKHNLSQAEQALLASRRAFKEERDLLVAKLRQYEAERDIRGAAGRPGLPPASPYEPYGTQQPPGQAYQPRDVRGGGGGGTPPPASGRDGRGGTSPGPPVWGTSAGHAGAGGPSLLAADRERLEVSGPRQAGGSAWDSYHQGVSSPSYAAAPTGQRPPSTHGGHHSAADAPFATPMHRSNFAAPQPSGSWGGNSTLVGPPQMASASGAYGGAGRSPRAAFEHLEKTLSDGERFLTNTQRRAAVGGVGY